jgi:ATP-dependent Zn protease
MAVTLCLASCDYQVFSCTASDFTTGYVGQAGNKTRDKFEEALGQVLFIDEAYRCVQRGLPVYRLRASQPPVEKQV